MGLKRDIGRHILGVMFLFSSGCSGESHSDKDVDVGDVGNTPEDVVGSDTDDNDAGPGLPMVTYHGSARSILESHCVACHSPGKIGPFPLDVYADAKDNSFLVQSVLLTGEMPPWQADPQCRPMSDERMMEDAEVETLLQWIAAGSPEGDPDDYVPPVVEAGTDLGPPELSMKAVEPYIPDTSEPDDLRCLIFDHTFEEETFVTASQFVPDATGVIHHVLIYRVPEKDVALLSTLDEEDPGPGYACEGGPKVGSGGPIGAWVPGMVPLVYPDGAALRIAKGTKLVMQVHYNTLNVGSADAAPGDWSTFQLWSLAPGETPDSLIGIFGLANGEIFIPEGEPLHTEEKSFELPAGITLIGVAPHMHLLGIATSLSVITKEGAEECLVEIPEWDFNWQQFYQYKVDSFYESQLGDTLLLSCTYDNSPGNQPVINGVPATSQDVVWGDSTLAEMCITFLIGMEPFVDIATPCPAVASCVAVCNPGDAGCFLDCLAHAGSACLECLLPKMTDCAAATCGAQLNEVGGCLTGCSSEDILTCLDGECWAPYEVLFGCLGPLLKEGSCDASFSTCGVAFALE